LKNKRTQIREGREIDREKKETIKLEKKKGKSQCRVRVVNDMSEYFQSENFFHGLF
jgi:hypothetical protein